MTSAEAKEQIDRQLGLLEQHLRTVRVDQQRFLAGDLKLPPDEDVQRVRGMIRTLRQKTLGVAEGYRLNTLEAQLNSSLELYERRLRSQERSVPRAAGASARPAFDTNAGVVIGARPSSRAEETLYKSLYLRGGSRRPKVDLERFRAQLRRSAEVIRNKTGCAEILFRVTLEDGKHRLKARPLRGPSS